MRTILGISVATLMIAAGCAAPSATHDEGLPVATATTSATPSAPNPVTNPRALEDGTVYFEPMNALSTKHPAGNQVAQIPVLSLGSPQSGDSNWKVTWPVDSASVLGGLNVTLEVRGLVLNGSPSTETDSCFWAFTLTFQANASGQSKSTLACANEPRIVPEGIRQRTLQFHLSDSVSRGSLLTLRLVAQAYLTSPDATLFLLADAADKNSSLEFVGVTWPAEVERLP